jgi:hypothetical protein
MPQPRKYRTDAERQAAYRQRHAKAKELSYEALRRGLLDLRQEITRRREVAKAKRIQTQWNPTAVRAYELIELVNYIELELDRLMAIKA